MTSQRLATRVAIVLLLCLAASLLLVTAALASRPPATNKITNPDFETGPGHFFPWFRDGNAQHVGAEGCCGQHETFFWPDGWNHGWSQNFNTGDSWDGYIWNENQPGMQWGSLAQSISSLPANQRYRLSAWMATSNGNAAQLRWYANGTTRFCASTTAIWPGAHVIWTASFNVSCELTPTNTSGFNVHMFANNNLSAGRWIVSDDWALTPLVTVPLHGMQRLNRPVKYWARDYANSVDRAVNNWEAATGRNLFEKATSEADAKLIIDGVFTFCDGASGGDNLSYGATYPIGYNLGTCFIAGDKQLVELNIWYFSRWSSDPKDSSIGHELGHVLGLGEVTWLTDACQLMRSGAETRYYYCGIVKPTSRDASSVP